MIHPPSTIGEHARDRIDRYRHDAAIQRAIREIRRASDGPIAPARRRIAAAIHRIAARIDVDAPRPASRDADPVSAR